MRGYFFIEFIDFTFNGESSTDFTSLISPHNSEKNEKRILDYLLK